MSKKNRRHEKNLFIVQMVSIIIILAICFAVPVPAHADVVGGVNFGCYYPHMGVVTNVKRKPHPHMGVVTKVKRKPHTQIYRVTFRDAANRRWSWFDDDPAWSNGDFVAVIMYDKGTPYNVYDDMVVSARYVGWKDRF